MATGMPLGKALHVRQVDQSKKMHSPHCDEYKLKYSCLSFNSSMVANVINWIQNKIYGKENFLLLIF
nr:MAG TPA: hypothetical protein [Caudoviricetes sp.]